MRQARAFSLIALMAFSAFGLSGCLSANANWDWSWTPKSKATEAVAEASSQGSQDGLKAAYWMQASAEYHAVVDLTYDLARIRLDEALADPSWTATAQQLGDYSKKPPAVILDVDETVLDNTAYQVWLAVAGETYSTASWNKFANAKESPAMKPALEFTKYAASKGVEVFYVTNRRVEIKQATRDNLIAEGFPVSDTVDTVLTKAEREDWTSEKEVRWAHIAKDYRVLLLIGDNIGDVAEGIYDTPEARHAIFEANRGKIGKSWIVLPNPTYGSWEGAAFGFDFRKPGAQKVSYMLGRMRDWEPKDEKPAGGETKPTK